VAALLTVIGDLAKLRICPQVLEGCQSETMLQTVGYLRVAQLRTDKDQRNRNCVWKTNSIGKLK